MNLRDVHWILAPFRLPLDPNWMRKLPGRSVIRAESQEVQSGLAERVPVCRVLPPPSLSPLGTG